jgi:hypothetical protein
MSLTSKTYAHLKSALTRKSLTDEFQAAITTPAPLSAKLKAAIIAMMANKAAGNEVINALQTGGHQVLSGPKNPNAARRFRDAMCNKAAADEISALI